LPPNADHLLMARAEDGIYVARLVSARVSQYIE